MPEVKVESGEPLWDLVADFLERRERGDRVDAESFIRSHPDVADRLRDALAGFQWMDAKARPNHASMDEVLPRGFGNYELLRVIGRGGMGCVYEAFHQPLKRHVAVKVLPPHLTDVREFRLRFLREARVIASLHHTNIAPVFEVGQIGNTLYLAMPFIDGPNLRELTLPLPDDRTDSFPHIRARLPVPFGSDYFRWVAGIGAQTADALAHAHGRGVIHRDVKPSNVLVDEHGAIWIVDFGLAKGPTHATVTEPGELIGTLRYASPEQVQGMAFDERTDVYSLGVTLYELATRRAAFPPSRGHEIMADPPRPRRVNPRVPRDLETIILRAMAKRPADRYATAAALADDLRRFLRDEPIRARPIGLLGRVIRWTRRNPAVTGVAAAAAVLLLAFLVFHLLREAEHRNTRTELEGISAERHAALQRLLAERSLDSGQPGRSRQALEMTRQAAQIEFRDELWELAIRAVDQVDIGSEVALQASHHAIAALAVRADGTELAGADPDGRIYFWNTGDGEVWSCAGFGEPISQIVWSSDGARIAAASPSGAWMGSVNAQARSLDNMRAVARQFAVPAFSPDGTRLALWGKTIALWDVEQSRVVWERPSPHADTAAEAPAPYHALAWSGDGALLAAALRGEATIEIWAMPDGKPVPPIGVVLDEVLPAVADQPVACLGFSPDGMFLASGCADGSIRMYRREASGVGPGDAALSGDGERLPRFVEANPSSQHPFAKPTLRGHERPLRSLAFLAADPAGRAAPAGSHVLLISADSQDVRIWDVAWGQQIGMLARNLNDLRGVSVDARGTAMAATDGSGAIGLWRLRDLRLHEAAAPQPRRVTAVAATHFNRGLAWCDERGHVVTTDVDLRGPRSEFDVALRDPRIVFSPGGSSLALAGDGDPPIIIRSVISQTDTELGAGAAAVRAVAFVGTGDALIAAAHRDDRMVIWNIQTAQPFATAVQMPLAALAASSDGKWLVGGGMRGDLHIWNTATMAHKVVTAAHHSEILAVAFSPDNRHIASASRDGQISRWRVPGLKRDLSFEGPGGSVRDLAFCLDGTTLVSTGGDGRVFLWAAERVARVGSLAARFIGHCESIAVTSDGKRLIAVGGPKSTTASGPGGIEIWDLAAIRQQVLAAGLPDWSAPTATVPEP